MGRGPVVLLLHGTGASTHSWRRLMPLLARRFTVVAPDLPGHAFTETPAAERLSLPEMGEAVADLLGALGLAPDCAVGHSAGAAILARMSLSNGLGARVLVSLNGALLPPPGIAGYVFSPMAKLLSMASIVPFLFARRAQDRLVVERLLASTGSVIDQAGIDQYARVMSNPTHVAAALGMMANWNLRELARDLPALSARLVLVAGSSDLTIPAESAFHVRDLVPSASVEILRGLGHLAHEENPELIARIIEREAQLGVGDGA
jgi:magnesium chelatase accessory protein